MTLQNREQCFQQAILDALPAEVCLLDESGTILSVNRAWLEFSASNDGPEAKTGVGANYLAVCDATEGPDREFAEKVARNLRCMLRGELNQFTLQYPCPSADSLLWFVLQAVRSSESDPRLVVITHTNITQLKQAEEKQRLDFQRHRVLFEEAPEGIVVLDEERKIIEANSGFARMLGFSRPEQVLGLHPWDWDPIYSTREKLLAAWPELPTQPRGTIRAVAGGDQASRPPARRFAFECPRGGPGAPRDTRSPAARPAGR